MSDLAKAFRDQARACSNLGSPFMGRLFDFLAQNWPQDSALARKCDSFAGDLGPASISLPLRIGGGLHALRLRGDAGLTAIYPPLVPTEKDFADGILEALARHDAFLTEWIDSPPQTNELRRSAALIPAARIAASQFGLPIWLSELGASGGLNLMWDQFALQGDDWRLGPKEAVVTLTPDWTGERPLDAETIIADRRGVDLTPLDPTNAKDLLRLTAYLWADQPHRLEMTRAGAGAVSAPVDKGDAIDWLEARLEQAPDSHLHIVQNTVAWQYFPEATQTRGRALLDAAGAVATPSRPLAWMQLETDGDLHGLGGAAITLQMWPDGKVHTLGRADFHGRWVKWGHAALQEKKNDA